MHVKEVDTYVFLYPFLRDSCIVELVDCFTMIRFCLPTCSVKYLNICIYIYIYIIIKWVFDYYGDSVLSEKKNGVFLKEITRLKMKKMKESKVERGKSWIDKVVQF